MRFFPTRISRITATYFLIFCLPVALLMMAWSFLNVQEYDVKISIFENDSLGIQDRKLPINQIRKTGQQSFVRSGEITVEWIDNNPKYLFIPFYAGDLKLYLNQKEIFDSSSSSTLDNAVTIERVMVSLPEHAPGSFQKLKFELSFGENIFGELSEIYIGNFYHLNSTKIKLDFFYNSLRRVFFGAEILAVLLMATLFITKTFDNKVFFPLIIVSYTLTVGLGSFGSEFPKILEFYPYLFALAPICLFALSEFRKNTLIPVYDFQPFPIIKFFACISFSLGIILLGFLTEIQTINTFIVVPILVLGMVHEFAKSLYIFIKKQHILSGIISAALASLIVTVGHDFLFRAGYLDTGIVASTLSVPLLLITLGVVLSVKLSEANKLILKHNLKLVGELEIHTARLEDEFKKTNQLNLQNSIHKSSLDQTNRLNAELHDGVSTYLSMINSISENSSEEKLKTVHKLSRYASNEIRIIMEAKDTTNASIFVALASFRKRVVDPLEHLGVVVEWDLRPIINYPPVRPEIIMNLVRIFQEAIHNAVERAQCTNLKVLVAQLEAGDVSILILNSGGATFNQSDKAGMGLRNMQTRAAEMGWHFSIKAIPTGASIQLILPKGSEDVKWAGWQMTLPLASDAL